MIIRCTRCNTEFRSEHTHTHTCPTCHLVFKEGEAKPDEFIIVRSSDLIHQRTGHSLLEESEEKCAFHPDIDAVSYCTQCGRPVCYACSVNIGHKCFCEPCVEDVGAASSVEPQRRRVHEVADKLPPKRGETRLETVSQALALQPYVAWEYRRQAGRFYALSLTWQRSLFFPFRFFRGVPLVGGYRSPLLYGIFWSLVGLAGGIAWKLLLYTYPKLAVLAQGHPVDITLQLSRAHAYAAVALLLSPVFMMLLLPAASALYHMFILLLTRQHAGYEGTLRVVCYGTGTNIFFFLPILGGVIGAIWQLVLIVVGLKEVHRLSFLRALVAALVPYSLLLTGGIAFMLWSVTEGFLNVNTVFVERVLSFLS